MLQERRLVQCQRGSKYTACHDDLHQLHSSADGRNLGHGPAESVWQGNGGILRCTAKRKTAMGANYKTQTERVNQKSVNF
jgi:hypothetical protein